MSDRLISERVPYIPIRLRFGRTSGTFDALLDTGFEGDVAVPERLVFSAGSADAIGSFRLADGTEIVRSIYHGSIAVGGLGIFPVRVTALGDECLIGRGVIDRFMVTFDHGRRLIVEP